MNINSYRAKQMHDFFREGKSIVKDEDIVFNVLHNSKEVMKTEEICKIPVKDIADNDCILFMWATFPNLPDALRVIQEWGFTYKTLGFSWIKKTKRMENTFLLLVIILNLMLKYV